MKTKKLGCLAFTLLSIGFVYCLARHFLYTDYNNMKAVEYLDSHAEPHSKSRCAMYVRLAIEAGGCPTFGQPPSACDYELFLPDLGFHKISTDSYTPQSGDVVVFSAITGHKDGHIAMYDGMQWVSDFKQSTMYSASGYYFEGSHSFWRRDDGKAWRVITINAWQRTLKNLLGFNI